MSNNLEVSVKHSIYKTEESLAFITLELVENVTTSALSIKECVYSHTCVCAMIGAVSF